MPDQGSLRVTERATVEIDAVSAKLHITISGENFIYGNAAVEKCKEVKVFVERVKALGLPDDAIKVKSVRVITSSGLLTKSSSGAYNLELRVANLSKLGDLLGAIGDQKSIALNLLEWVYNENDAQLAAAELAMKKAKKKADLLMSCVGHRVTGIKSCSDQYNSLQDTNVRFETRDASLSRVRAAVAAPRADIGTEFKSSKEIEATVSVDFIINAI